MTELLELLSIPRNHIKFKKRKNVFKYEKNHKYQIVCISNAAGHKDINIMNIPKLTTIIPLVLFEQEAPKLLNPKKKIILYGDD